MPAKKKAKKPGSKTSVVWIVKYYVTSELKKATASGTQAKAHTIHVNAPDLVAADKKVPRRGRTLVSIRRYGSTEHAYYHSNRLGFWGSPVQPELNVPGIHVAESEEVPQEAPTQPETSAPVEETATPTETADVPPTDSTSAVLNAGAPPTDDASATMLFSTWVSDPGEEEDLEESKDQDDSEQDDSADTTSKTAKTLKEIEDNISRLLVTHEALRRLRQRVQNDREALVEQTPTVETQYDEYQKQIPLVREALDELAENSDSFSVPEAAYSCYEDTLDEYQDAHAALAALQQRISFYAEKYNQFTSLMMRVDRKVTALQTLRARMNDTEGPTGGVQDEIRRRDEMAEVALAAEQALIDATAKAGRANLTRIRLRFIGWVLALGGVCFDGPEVVHYLHQPPCVPGVLYLFGLSLSLIVVGSLLLSTGE